MGLTFTEFGEQVKANGSAEPIMVLVPDVCFWLAITIGHHRHHPVIPRQWRSTTIFPCNTTIARFMERC